MTLLMIFTSKCHGHDRAACLAIGRCYSVYNNICKRYCKVHFLRRIHACVPVACGRGGIGKYTMLHTGLLMLEERSKTGYPFAS